ncbi:MAG: hypothetical protein Q4B65_02215 [Candidatus Saccharibacteria bacterium]|nr:hypothetical protein [Candidatus Saccharibacteria bacterium]
MARAESYIKWFMVRGENRAVLWFNPRVIELSEKNLRDLRGTGSMLGTPEFGTMNIFEAIAQLKEKLSEKNNGALIIKDDEIDIGFMEFLVNPTIDTKEEASKILSEAAQEYFYALKCFANKLFG